MAHTALVADNDRADALVIDVMVPNLDGLGVFLVLRADGAPAVIHTIRGVGYTMRRP